MLKKCDTSKPYVFVSYSHADKEVVHRDVKKFKELGYNIWFDKELDKKQPGWDIEAFRRIRDRNCELVLFYFSENSILSENCRNELCETRSDGAKLLHKRKEVPFIAVNVSEVGDLDEFIDICIDKVINSESDPDKQVAKAKAIDDFIGSFFRNNTKIRQDSFETYEDKKDYYLELEKDFPKVIKEQRKSDDSVSQVSAVPKDSTAENVSQFSPAQYSKQQEVSETEKVVATQPKSSNQAQSSNQEKAKAQPTPSPQVVENSQKPVVDSSTTFIEQVLDYTSNHDYVAQWGLESRKPQKDFVNVVSQALKDKGYSHYFDWQVSGTSLTNSLRDSSSQKKLGAAISEYESDIIAKINERVSEELSNSVVNSLLDKAKPAIQIRTTALSKNSDVEQAALWFLKATDIMMSVLSEYC